MTREEAITLMKSAQLMLVNPKTNEPISDLYEALDIAIKALENKPRFILHSDGKIEQIIESCGDMLDNIRDEICNIDDEIVLNPDSFYERKVYVRFSKVIDIIDKYKTESEVNNG